MYFIFCHICTLTLDWHKEFSFKEVTVNEDGTLEEETKNITYHFSNTAGQFGGIKPSDWTGERKAPGEIQMARANLIQTYGRLKQGIKEYDNLIANIKGLSKVIKAQYDGNIEDLDIQNAQIEEQIRLSDKIAAANEVELVARRAAETALNVANAVAEAFPESLGFSCDCTSVGRAAALSIGNLAHIGFSIGADIAAAAKLRNEQALDLSAARTDLTLTTNANNQAYLEAFTALQELIREEVPMQMELFSLQENINQAIGEYQAILAEGARVQDSYFVFRRQTAANVQSRRYKDMAFRIFRNDALQKYRAQYDLAARYVYLAAKAYDYETTLLSGTNAGQNFLTSIIKQRLIGTMNGNVPQQGAGLADPMAKMAENFGVFKTQFGFNNPIQETERFSLRFELFRIGNEPEDDEKWRNTLRAHVVDNMLDIPEFKRYCKPPNPVLATGEPAIVIPFSSTITNGLNFFGHEAIGGDHAYNSSKFTTKVRSVGTWFGDYSTLQGDGLLETPKFYLVPVGVDIQRSPSNSGTIREFKILDQVIPPPNAISDTELGESDWLPSNNLAGTFAQNRRFSSNRAYHDSGDFSTNEVHRNSRLIGRSVWNTRWLLIIPAHSLLGDREEGLNRFIDGLEVNGERNGNGISDIKLFFETISIDGF